MVVIATLPFTPWASVIGILILVFATLIGYAQYIQQRYRKKILCLLSRKGSMNSHSLLDFMTHEHFGYVDLNLLRSVLTRLREEGKIIRISGGEAPDPRTCLYDLP